MGKKIRISILGSTGSIGKNSLEVIKNLNSNGFEIEIVSLTTNSNVSLLHEQIKEFNPETVVITQNTNSTPLPENVEVIFGEIGLAEICSRGNYDILISSLVGFAGLAPTIEAIKLGKRIALANKETLVVAGSIISHLSKKHKATVIPIDSEHSAVLQSITGERANSIKKIILTASGGPFRTWTPEEMQNATVEDALNHPNWDMGSKITIDSATMMNKGLEVIEAKWLFDLEPENIEVVIHPQSIIHSMVEFIDGSIKAQLGIPDMKIPIQYALTYPERCSSDFPKMDFTKNQTLTFEKPDTEKFECLKIAYEVLKSGGTYAVVLNAANEIAIGKFLNKEIGFLDIPKMIRRSLDDHSSRNIFELEDIYEIDRLTRTKLSQNINVNST